MKISVSQHFVNTVIKYFNSLLFVLVVSVLPVASAHAVVLYFSANCIDCAAQAATPTYGVNGILTLSNDYQFDTQITHENFISFEYLGSNLFGAFTVFDTPGTGLGGVIDNVPGSNWFAFIREDGLFFETNPDGSWILCPNGLQGEMFACAIENSADFGNAATFAAVPPVTSVPEPGTIALLSVGFGLALFGRKRRAMRRLSA